MQCSFFLIKLVVISSHLIIEWQSSTLVFISQVYFCHFFQNHKLQWMRIFLYKINRVILKMSKAIWRGSNFVSKKIHPTQKSIDFSDNRKVVWNSLNSNAQEQFEVCKQYSLILFWIRIWKMRFWDLHADQQTGLWTFSKHRASDWAMKIKPSFSRPLFHKTCLENQNHPLRALCSLCQFCRIGIVPSTRQRSPFCHGRAGVSGRYHWLINCQMASQGMSPPPCSSAQISGTH